MTTWRWPRYHFPLLDPFVNISVCCWCGGVNIEFLGSGTNVYGRHLFMSGIDCNLSSPGEFDKFEFRFCSFIRTLSQNNGSNNNNEVKVPQILWRNQLQEASGDLPYHQDGTHTHTHKLHIYAAIISSIRGLIPPEIEIAMIGACVSLQCSHSSTVTTWCKTQQLSTSQRNLNSLRKYTSAINCTRVQITSFLFMRREHLSGS